ncbi:class I SAM-dependent methyltransferase [Hymenobacter sp. BT507]|uniref:Class I SAM-dependent methyltransferase n=1 Tax=Hymenobacter citatus TaxID=2763506 RepID=A0ABR7MQ77_9BACT|nr:class I SAM-dependent methyltransferase [Hymenobacter citatus]MBC6613236.1 class I SAM-dependent methyltransferase [Hymenobacter citatus]
MLTELPSRLLRALGLLLPAHYAKYRWTAWRNRRRNQRFRCLHPHVTLPPDYLMYESFGLDYHRYWHGGRQSSEWVVRLLSQHLSLDQARVLEWGCGPGRLIRHLPQLLPGATLFGTDYNPASIAWCKQHLPGIEFTRNQLQPPLPYSAAAVDALYAVSIFTHLSAAAHRAWWTELTRVVRPGGVVLFTTHGRAFRYRLSAPEQQQFDAGELVVWGRVPEGHRNFAAFQPEHYVRQLVQPHTVLEFIPGALHPVPQQDTWLIRIG